MAGHFVIVQTQTLPSGPGTPEPQAGFCVQCGGGVVCRADRAAADTSDSRTEVSPGRALDRSEPVHKAGQKLLFMAQITSPQHFVYAINK